METTTHEENLERYRQALNATTDDEERKDLFLTIACILEQQRNPPADSIP